MSPFDIVRAWKDAEYRQSLSIEDQELVPEHPAGSIELTDEDLPQVAGGFAGTGPVLTAGCCSSAVFTYCSDTTCQLACTFIITTAL